MVDQALTLTQAASRLSSVHSAILGLGVRRLALFGSVPRGTARADSDVDVLVEFAPGQKSFDRFLALGDLLEDLFGHPVELLTPESLSPFLRSHILAESQDVIRAA